MTSGVVLFPEDVAEAGGVGGTSVIPGDAEGVSVVRVAGVEIGGEEWSGAGTEAAEEGVVTVVESAGGRAGTGGAGGGGGTLEVRSRAVVPPTTVFLRDDDC